MRNIKLFTIGNSFSQNATLYLPDLVEADPEVELKIGKACLGGCSLERHWNHAAAFEADPFDPQGSPYHGGQYSLKNLLLEDDWDIVTMQQFSFISNDYRSYQPFADQLKDYVLHHVPAAEIRVHQTWAYRADDKRFGGPGDSQEKMHRELTAAYWQMAADLHARILPVGKAFGNARRDSCWNFKYPDPGFDYENPNAPNLPDQSFSLCKGYLWKQDEETGEWGLRMDGHHANACGQYLGAAVFFECLFEKSILDNPFVPEEITPEDAQFLREIAHKTVAETPAVKTPPDRRE